MSNLNLDAIASVHSSTPFCADTYYAGLRAAGCDPVIRDGAVHMLLNLAPELDAWAAHQDPDGSLRIEYARAVWAKRTSDEEAIPLGVRH